jgi:hypothetical protein
LVTPPFLCLTRDPSLPTSQQPLAYANVFVDDFIGAAQTIQLPQHRVDRLAEILNSIPTTQRRTSVKKWYSILGELRSMALALPGSRNIFSTMQHALTNKAKGQIALKKEVHNALDDFWWMHNNIATRPTRIAEIIPLLPAAEGHHDVSSRRQYHPLRRLRQRKTHPMALRVTSGLNTWSTGS